MADNKADKLDYLKVDKALYKPGAKPVLVQVPQMGFFMMDGVGDPDGPVYQNAVGVLYALTFTIKMSKMGSYQPPGYHDYTTPPLEGLWGGSPLGPGENRSAWRWTSLIRQPEFVDEGVFRWALAEAMAKKKKQGLTRALDFTGVRYQRWEEGLCVQLTHTGPYSTEPESIHKLELFMEENGLEPAYDEMRRHHELYMGDPRRQKPEKRKTVLRLPVRRV